MQDPLAPSVRPFFAFPFRFVFTSSAELNLPPFDPALILPAPSDFWRALVRAGTCPCRVLRHFLDLFMAPSFSNGGQVRLHTCS